MVSPVFNVSSPQKLFNQMQEPLIRDALFQDAQEDFMVQAVEAGFDVPLDPPSRPGHFLDLLQGRVTTPSRSKAVRVVGECRFVDGLKDKLHYGLK